MKFEEWKEIHEYCLNKACAYETRPFGEYPLCYRIAGKIFAQLTPKEDWYKITLKTNPDAADFYRRIYPDVVVRGYHCPPVQQPYWNTINLHLFQKDNLFQMIDEAYDEVVMHLPKKEQKRLPDVSKCRFVKTSGEDTDLAELYNGMDPLDIFDIKSDKKIRDVIIVYKDHKAVACGAYKFYDEESVELKCIYVDELYRGLGIGRELLRRLESDAKIAGYRYAILETDAILEKACEWFKKQRYKTIQNEEQYVPMPEFSCMQKKL